MMALLDADLCLILLCLSNRCRKLQCILECFRFSVRRDISSTANVRFDQETVAQSWPWWPSPDSKRISKPNIRWKKGRKDDSVHVTFSSPRRRLHTFFVTFQLFVLDELSRIAAVLACRLSTAANLLSSRIVILPIVLRSAIRLYIWSQKRFPGTIVIFRRGLNRFAIPLFHALPRSNLWRPYSMQTQKSVKHEPFASQLRSPYFFLFFRPLPSYLTLGSFSTTILQKQVFSAL